MRHSLHYHAFSNALTLQSLDQLQVANPELLDRVHRMRKSDTLLMDLDSSHADTYGKQENALYNSHYGTVGFHPLVAFDGLTGDFLKAQLRPGNVYTSNGVVDFLRPLIEHYNETFPSTSALVRGDSGFAVPELYELCEQATKEAQQYFETAFQKKQIPDQIPTILIEIGKETIADVVPSLIERDFIKSKSEFLRLVKQNGVSLNGEKLSADDTDRVLMKNDVIQIGKKRFVKFIK